MSENKNLPFAVNREGRKQRRENNKRSVCSYAGQCDEETEPQNGEAITTENTEKRQILVEMAQSFLNTIDFYKADYGGSKPHDEAVKEALQMNEWRRGYIESLEPEKVEWGHFSAIAEHNPDDSFKLWARIREVAADELESGRRSGKVLGINREPYELAQFFAVRDSFADQWQPTGGIESALIDMMAVAFSLQMYWSTVAHQRALKIHNDQKKDLGKYENKGWKSPYQYEAEATEQAHRLADGYNRQFLRVLRQLRDLRRYSPVVIQNNGGQVNVGNQQVNVNKS